MGTRWRGLLAPLGVSTGDGRRFKTDGVTHRQLPLPLKWQRTDSMGHDDSVVIGSTDTITIDTKAGEVWGEGELFDDINPLEMPRLAEDVAEAKHLLDKQVIGPSVDPGAVAAVLAEKGSDEPVSEDRLEEILMEAWDNGTDPELEVLFTEYEIAAATLVTVPAFAECRPFELVDAPTEAALTAAVRASGWSDLPLAGRDAEWDGDAAAGRLADHCALDEEEDADWGCYAAGFLYQDDQADENSRGAYGFGIVDVIDGSPTIVPAGVYAVASVLEGGRGGTQIPDEDQEAMKKVVSGIYSRMAEEFDDDTIRAPWDTGDGDAATETPESTASLVAALTAAAPIFPADWFSDPRLAQITPLTVGEPDQDGLRRVVGHVAAFGVCHVGIKDVCATAPTSEREYAEFHRYDTTSSGVTLPLACGRITVGHGRLRNTCSCCRGNDDHACSRLSMGAAIAHHDQMHPVAFVRAGEDQFGIWVAGIIAPEADEKDLTVLGRQKVSGDWREVAGNLELVEVLALAREKPGFPLPRMTARDGRQRSLVAAGAVRPSIVHRAVGTVEQRVLAGLDYALLGKEVAAALAVQGLTTLTAGATGAPSTVIDPPAGGTTEPGGLVDEVALARLVEREQLTKEIEATGRAAAAVGLLRELEGV